MENKQSEMALEDLVNWYEELPVGHKEGFTESELELPFIEYHETTKKKPEVTPK